MRPDEHRELALLASLSTSGRDARTPGEAATACAASLADSPGELPFAAIYLLVPEEPCALRAVATREDLALPTHLPVAGGSPWRVAEALRGGDPVVVRLAEVEVPAGPVEQAAVVAIVEPNGSDRLGVLVAGLDPRRPFDDHYRAFVRLVASGTAGALARARERETSRRQRAALEESERRFARFMAHLPGMAWIKDPDGRYLYVNAAAGRAFGRYREDVLGRTDEQIFPSSTAAEFRRNDALAHEGAVEAIETLEHEDGVHHSLVSKFPIPRGPGDETLVGGIAIDVTQRVRAEAAVRESEARFRTMADHVPVLLWVNGLEGCEFVNREYLRFLGRSWEEVQGSGWHGFVHPEDREGYVSSYLRAFEAREVFEAQVRLRRADGEHRWLRSTGVPRFTADGSLVGYVGCSIDITDLKRSEQSLKDADRRKDEFLATLAHELRNPLAPLRNGLEAMRIAGPSDPEALARARGIMERQLRQIVRLIDDLLDLSRISSGKLELRKEPLLLADVLQSALETMKPALDASGRALAVDTPEEPLPLEGDLTRLAQVFANLLDNAIKYTDAGGSIRLHARREGDSIVVSVADDGIGISPDALSGVFAMFTQGDPKTGASRGGLGVGLSIVRRLVAMHGGTIEARSEGLGRGADFVVRLPALAPEAAPSPPPPAEARPPGSPRRILVVDDNEDSAESLALILQLKGNEVRTAHEGREALGVAESFRPQVVFLDIGMPGQDGHSVCRQIRARTWGRELPIVALTGWGQEEDRRRSEESGFTHHLVKPADPAALDRLLAGLSASPPFPDRQVLSA